MKQIIAAVIFGASLVGGCWLISQNGRYQFSTFRLEGVSGNQKIMHMFDTQTGDLFWENQNGGTWTKVQRKGLEAVGAK